MPRILKTAGRFAIFPVRFLIVYVLIDIAIDVMTARWPIQFPEWAEYAESYWREFTRWAIGLLPPDTGEESWGMTALKYALAKLRTDVRGDEIIGVGVALGFFLSVWIVWRIVTHPFRRLWQYGWDWWEKQEEKRTVQRR